MFGECCPECGHLLSNQRSTCAFCGWDYNLDQDSYTLKIENDLADHLTGEYRPDLLAGY